MTIKRETTADLILLIQQRAETFNDHKSELAEELEEIQELVDQLESRIPFTMAFQELIAVLNETRNALLSIEPEYLTGALQHVKQTHGR